MHKGENALVKWKVCRINLLLTSWDKRPNGSSTEVISFIMEKLEMVKDVHLKTHTKKANWNMTSLSILNLCKMFLSYLLSKTEILASNSVGTQLFFLGRNQDNIGGSNFITKKKICLVLPEKEISNHRN